ncbi:baeRF2 domain-containing protein [Blastococcus atacamensis]|uniref:baeRF2 domain-containing protein n=1 Tax=Blastococcus atacamensis TaxID=2070508 RepID=UPI000CEBCD3D|nr:Vms1/Ankzf1 family peptidyl-tRNA hydrolase [Blastococcus atacamensis]
MDVSFLEPVFAAAGPFATVLADVTHTTENAGTELDLRVRAIAERLTEQGVPEPVLETVRSRLLEGNDGGAAGELKGRAVVVAADGTVVLDQALAAAPLREVAEWSPKPDLLPVLRQLPGRVPHIVVLTDRIGADITYFGGAGQVEEEQSVEGDSVHIHKFQGGGWAHHRYQHNTENKWIHNAEDVAQHIASMVRRLGPRFVLVAGDIRARQILTDRASDLWSDLIVSMDEGGRAAGADRAPVDAREAELVAEHEAREIAETVEKIEAAAAHGLSVTGVDHVVEALRKGQVETLVLADAQESDATLLVGNNPLELGVDQQDMDALGIHGDVVPADRALLAAAVASAADVVVVPHAAMPEEATVAAILRYTDASTDAGN